MKHSKRIALLTLVFVFFISVLSPVYAATKPPLEDCAHQGAFQDAYAIQSTELASIDSQRETPQATFSIVYPSTTQGTISPGRDFYVIGTISNGSTIPSSSKLKVTLLKNNQVQQEVIAESKDNYNGLWMNYPKLTTYSSSFNNQCAMPDLVYIAGEALGPDGIPPSFKDAWRKCYYTDKFFAALFISGTDNTLDLNNNRQDGTQIPELTSGTYTVRVTLLDSTGNSYNMASKTISVQHSSKIILSRFSPDEHNQRVTQYANENGVHILLDPFPGYWSKSLLPEIRSNGGDFFGEIKPRWRTADAQEYVTSTSHFFMYNVTPTSATYNVEIGKLQSLQRIQSMTRLYYKYGEPSLPNMTPTSSLLSTMPSSDKVAITRVDYQSTAGAADADNVLNTATLTNAVHNILPSSAAAVKKDRQFSVYGVCAPIQNVSSDIVYDSSERTYTINNVISKAVYTFKNSSGQTLDTFTKQISGLARTFGSGSAQNSVLEFRHVFSLNQQNYSTGSTYTVSVEFFDSHNASIDTKSFNILVQ